MALILPRSIFYHIPKTGGTWVHNALVAAGIPVTESGQSFSGHDTFRSAKHPGKFTFAFVRHPLTWYPSFWTYRMTRGWRTDDSLDLYMSSDFEMFMKNVLKYSPGHLTLRYEKYVGSVPVTLDFVGRQETLPQDLIRALRMAGEEFDENKILTTPRANVSTALPTYSDQILEAVLEAESGAMMRFGYVRPDGSRRVHGTSVLADSDKRQFFSPQIRRAQVFGTSMLPFIRPEDKLWHEPVQVSSIGHGDVITFSSGRDALVTHRVVKVLRRNGHPVFLTKGDDCLNPDHITLPERVIGRVVRVGRLDLTRPWWRFLGKVAALVSYFQWRFYERFKIGVKDAMAFIGCRVFKNL